MDTLGRSGAGMRGRERGDLMMVCGTLVA